MTPPDKAVPITAEQIVETIRVVESLDLPYKDSLLGCLQNLLLYHVKKSPLESDPRIYYAVISFLGVTALVVVVIAGLIAGSGRAVPDIFTAMGAACIGALAGLLAPQVTRSGR